MKIAVQTNETKQMELAEVLPLLRMPVDGQMDLCINGRTVQLPATIWNQLLTLAGEGLAKLP